MIRWKKRTAVALVVALAGLQVVPAAADEAEVKKKVWELTDEGWVYYKGDGNRVQNGLKQIQGKYYFFEDEIMAQGQFVEEDGEKYYAMPEGVIAQGENGKGQWLYLTAGGDILPDNTDPAGVWYCFDDDGRMVRDTRLTTDGSTPNFFDGDGKMVAQSWVRMNGDGSIDVREADEGPEFNEEGPGLAGDWRYYGFDGYEAAKKFLNVGGVWFWFDREGVAQIANIGELKAEGVGEISEVKLSVENQQTDFSVSVGTPITVSYDVVVGEIQEPAPVVFYSLEEEEEAQETDSVDDAIADPADNTVADPADDTVTDPADDTVTDLVDDTVTDPADDTVTDPADNTVTDPADDTVTDLVDDTVTDPADDTVTDPADNTVTDPADDTVTDPADDPVADPADDTVTVPAGDTDTVPAENDISSFALGDAILFSGEGIYTPVMTKDHDYWAETSFSPASGIILPNSCKLKRNTKIDEGKLEFTFTARYPGIFTFKPCVDGEYGEEVTINVTWGDSPEAQKAAKEAALTSALNEVNSADISVKDSVNSLVYLGDEMDSEEEKESLQTAIEGKIADIQELESSYVFAGNISQSNTVSDDAQNLLSSDDEPQIIGAVMNASENSSVTFTVAQGDTVELPQSCEKEVSLDLSLEIDGEEESDLTIPAQITVPIPAGMSADGLKLYHEHNGELEEVDMTVSGNKATFMTAGFSNFVFAGAASDEPSVPDSGNSGSGSSGGSSRGGSSSGGKSHNSVKGWVSQTKGIITGEGSSYSKWQPEQAADGSMKWKLTYADGTMAAGTIQTRADGTTYEQPAWEKVNGAWYPFGADGFVKDGWVQDEQLGGIFYIDINQGMMTGWQLVDNKWYYFNPVSDGTMGILRVNTWIDGWYVGADGSWDQQPQTENQ